MIRLVIPQNVPKPTGWHVLVIPIEPPDKTKGGIFIPDDTKDAARAASLVVYVVDIGPDAWTDKSRYPSGPWCKPSDFVLIGRWAGRRFKVGDVEMRILNEDDVLAVVPKPEEISSILF